MLRDIVRNPLMLQWCILVAQSRTELQALLHTNSKNMTACWSNSYINIFQILLPCEHCLGGSPSKYHMHSRFYPKHFCSVFGFTFVVCGQRTGFWFWSFKCVITDNGTCHGNSKRSVDSKCCAWSRQADNFTFCKRRSLRIFFCVVILVSASSLCVTWLFCMCGFISTFHSSKIFFDWSNCLVQA